MINASLIKTKARTLLFGKYGFFAVFILMYYACTLIANAIPSALFSGAEAPAVNVLLRLFLSFLLLILVNLIGIGVSRAAFCICFEKETSLRDVFYAFGENRDQFLKIEILLSAIQSGVSLLLMLFDQLNAVFSFDIWEYLGMYAAFNIVILILNLALSLRFTFAVYVVMEQPGISALAAIRASLALTRGRYLRYLLFRLSFAGMYALGYLSFLIGFLYVLPYIEVSTCLYYKDVRGGTA